MLKRLGMIIVAIVTAIAFTILLPMLLTAWANETDVQIFTCNANQGAQCSFVQVPPMTNTTATTTQILTTALPITVSIRITTASPILEFKDSAWANYVIGNGTVTEATFVKESNRTAIISVLIPKASSGQTQTIFSIFVYPDISSGDHIDENFTIHHLTSSTTPTPTPSTTPTPTPTPSTTPTPARSTTPTQTPSLTPNVPISYYMPIIHTNYCHPFIEFCLGSNDSLATAPEIELDKILNRSFTGTLNTQGDPRDYFRVTIPDSKPYTISINALALPISGGDLDLFLYDTAQKPVCQSSFVGKSNENIRINYLPCSSSLSFTTTKILPGTYTILVKYAFSGVAVDKELPYTLTISTVIP